MLIVMYLCCVVGMCMHVSVLLVVVLPGCICSDVHCVVVMCVCAY